MVGVDARSWEPMSRGEIPKQQQAEMGKWPTWYLAHAVRSLRTLVVDARSWQPRREVEFRKPIKSR